MIYLGGIELEVLYVLGFRRIKRESYKVSYKIFKTAAFNRSATSPYYFKTPISKDFQQYLNATYIHIISICVYFCVYNSISVDVFYYTFTVSLFE